MTSKIEKSLKLIDSLMDRLSAGRPKDFSVVSSEPKKVDGGFYLLLISREGDNVRSRVFGENISVSDVIMALEDVARSLLEKNERPTAIS